MNECEIVVYNKGVDFEILSNFYFKHLYLKSFWCSNRRYNESHVSICTNKVRKRFELIFMRMNECEIVVYNKHVVRTHVRRRLCSDQAPGCAHACAPPMALAGNRGGS